MHYKRLIGISLILFFVFVLSGCGNIIFKSLNKNFLDKPTATSVPSAETNGSGTEQSSKSDSESSKSLSETSPAPDSQKPDGSSKPLNPEGEKPENQTQPSPSPANEPDTDRPLKGRLVVIDPGHQSVMKNQSIPIAPGESEKRPDFAIGTKGTVSGVFEYEIVLDVSKKLKKELEHLGAKVVLTRETHDVFLGNADRAQIANDLNADVFIRIHCDGVDDPTVKGLSMLYPGDKYIKDKVMLENSLALSKAILDRTIEATNAKNRGLSKRNDLLGFNYCKVPCTLIEMGFMTNPEEDKLLNSEDYQNKLVKGMTLGIKDYLLSQD